MKCFLLLTLKEVEEFKTMTEEVTDFCREVLWSHPGLILLDVELISGFKLQLQFDPFQLHSQLHMDVIGLFELPWEGVG